MARPRGLNTYLRVVSRLRRLTDRAGRTAADANWIEAETFPERPASPLIWLHARRAEEARWMPLFLQMLEDERGEKVQYLLTTEEPPAFDTELGALHQPAPQDTSRSAERFLDHWRPDLGIFLNAPDRPVLITRAEAAGVPMFLAATRRSETQARPRLPILNAALLNCFRRSLAASASDAEALRRQGMDPARVEVTGPLIDTSAPLPCDLAEHDRLRAVLAGHPVWLAVDVTDEDIETVLQAHRRARRTSHRLILTVVPRDDTGVLPVLERSQWRVGSTDRMMKGEEGFQIVIGTRADRALWYRIAPITFTGGSFDDELPSADPFEAALLGSAVIHGPATAPFDARFRRLAAGGGALPLTDPEEIASAIEYLLAPDRAAEFAHAGWSVTSEAAPAIDRLVALTNDIFDANEARI